MTSMLSINTLSVMESVLPAIVHNKADDQVFIKIQKAFNHETAGKILFLILEGNSLNRICAMPEMPSYAEFHVWRIQNPAYNDVVKTALIQRTEKLAEDQFDMLALAKKEVTDPKTRDVNWGAFDRTLRITLQIQEREERRERRREDKHYAEQDVEGPKGRPILIEDPFKGYKKGDIEKYRINSEEEAASTYERED